MKTEKKKLVFLEAFRNGALVKDACLMADVSRTTVFNWRRDDAEFALAYLEAEQDHIDELEACVRDRAVHGVKKIVLWQGRPVIDPRKLLGEDHADPYLYESAYSDALLMFALRNKAPEKYCERTRAARLQAEMEAQREAKASLAESEHVLREIVGLLDALADPKRAGRDAAE